MNICFIHSGALAVKDASDKIVWSTDTGSEENKDAFLVVEDDGRVRILHPDDGRVIWEIVPPIPTLDDDNGDYNDEGFVFVTQVAPSAPPVSTLEPSARPTESSDMRFTTNVTYVPGELSVWENGLVLSTGLRSKLIATSGERVEFADEGMSNRDFHEHPDGAAIFSVLEDGGWVYASNAEVSEEDDGIAGGAGAIRFNKYGEVIDYYRILEDTRKNCGGGKTRKLFEISRCFFRLFACVFFCFRQLFQSIHVII